jgi:thiamine biosynthesis lipoprotein ApbE
MVDEERLAAEIAVVEEHKGDILLHFTVQDDETAAGAAMVIKEVSDKKRAVEKERKEAVAPLVAKKREVDGWYKQWTKPLDEINNHLRRQLSAYEREKEADRRKALEAATVAESPKEAMALMEQATSKSSKVQGVSVQSFLDFEVVDFAQVPDEFKVLDEQKIKKHLKDTGEGVKINGLRIFTNKRIRA